MTGEQSIALTVTIHSAAECCMPYANLDISVARPLLMVQRFDNCRPKQKHDALYIYTLIASPTWGGATKDADKIGDRFIFSCDNFHLLCRCCWWVHLACLSIRRAMRWIIWIRIMARMWVLFWISYYRRRRLFVIVNCTSIARGLMCSDSHLVSPKQTSASVVSQLCSAPCGATVGNLFRKSLGAHANDVHCFLRYEPYNF